LVAIIVRDYDRALRFFCDVLDFELVEDTPSLTNDGRPKRWVVVRPPGAETGVLLAQADAETQRAAAGEQFAGRVGMFLRVDDFDRTFRRLEAAGATIVRPLATSRTGASPCSSTVRGIAGTCSARRPSRRGLACCIL
jgi:catechol 2,3-dioxygenase-like lactoylglutathione lyase family enzyme